MKHVIQELPTEIEKRKYIADIQERIEKAIKEGHLDELVKRV